MLKTAKYTIIDKFLTKKRKLDDGDDDIADEKVNALPPYTLTSCSKMKTKNRQYLKAYPLMISQFTNQAANQFLECLISGEKLSNEAMAPSKLKMHLITNTKHSHIESQSISLNFFLISVESEYLMLTINALKISLKFSTS